jgi:hypothetical protein
LRSPQNPPLGKRDDTSLFVSSHWNHEQL